MRVTRSYGIEDINKKHLLRFYYLVTRESISIMHIHLDAKYADFEIARVSSGRPTVTELANQKLPDSGLGRMWSVELNDAHTTRPDHTSAGAIDAGAEADTDDCGRIHLLQPLLQLLDLSTPTLHSITTSRWPPCTG